MEAWKFCVFCLVCLRTVTTIPTSSTPRLTLSRQGSSTQGPDNKACGIDGNIESVYGNYYGYYSNYEYWQISYYYINTTWYNVSFWGGHLQISWKDNIEDRCVNEWGYTIMLSEKHPEVQSIGEDILTVGAVIRNHSVVQDVNVKIEMRMCNGDLLYRFPWSGIYDEYYYHTYICSDMIYNNCSSENVYTNGTVIDGLLDLRQHWYHTGWLNAFVDGRQYVLPSFKDVPQVFEKCGYYQNYNSGYFLKETMPEKIGDAPIRLELCYVHNNYYNDYNSYDGDYSYEENCSRYVYARQCHGNIMFDFNHQYWGYSLPCLVHYNKVKISPEIVHVSSSDGIYIPYLQYRCSFQMIGSYIVKWYINGSLKLETGPSSKADDLVLKGDTINNLHLGYQVKCGVMAIESGVSNETFSDDFYAGWKISDTSVRVSKNGFAMVDIEQTVPLGCSYQKDEEENCIEILSLVDLLQYESACSAGIHVMNADETGISYHKVKRLTVGEKWEETNKYRFRLTTIDKNYDDRLHFELELQLSQTQDQIFWEGAGEFEFITNLEVKVIQSDINRNKRCYSHVDPHMRTADGSHYEQQREGDHMFYRNLAYQTEVQETARYCSPGYSDGPVCACGIAVRSGADVFMINRCGQFTFMDFLQCGDGGILDVERVHDYRYKVITPIGTIVDISLHTWSKTMNIDIYLSAKDFNNIDGLCGMFDGNRNNDFRLRDGSTTAGNSDYAFSDSWRLTEEENLFKNGSRFLEHWNESSGVSPGQSCDKPNSITRNKCHFEKRHKRETAVRLGMKSYRKVNSGYQTLQRKERSVGAKLSEEAAKRLCNSSIFDAPAVREFPNQLAEEDPREVISQCVFDVVQGNNTAWADTHVEALNNIATSVLELNPVYAANNTESVNKFLLQTCLNNCSGNGACLESGLCNCGGTFRGPDCGTDLRIPPVIYDVQDGGICDTAVNEDCTCFVVRTGSIFEGFMYEMSTYKVYFDGTRTPVGKSTHEGEYEDIFTGVCCVPAHRRRRELREESASVILHDITLSNDGNNFGTGHSVYVYNSTCLYLNFSPSGEIVSVQIREAYCYIGDMCISQESTLHTSTGCFVCRPEKNKHEWTEVSCDDNETVGLSPAMLTGIVAGSVLAGAVITAVVVYLRCCKGKRKFRAVDDVLSSQTSFKPGVARTVYRH